jgi:hypothetical protein
VHPVHSSSRQRSAAQRSAAARVRFEVFKPIRIATNTW